MIQRNGVHISVIKYLEKFNQINKFLYLSSYRAIHTSIFQPEMKTPLIFSYFDDAILRLQFPKYLCNISYILNIPKGDRQADIWQLMYPYIWRLGIRLVWHLTRKDFTHSWQVHKSVTDFSHTHGSINICLVTPIHTIRALIHS